MVSGHKNDFTIIVKLYTKWYNSWLWGYIWNVCYRAIYVFSMSSFIAKEFLIEDLISRIVVTENGIFIYQNLSLGVDSQKQIKFGKLRLSLLPYSLLNMLHSFFDHLVYHDRNPLLCWSALADFMIQSNPAISLFIKANQIKAKGNENDSI